MVIKIFNYFLYFCLHNAHPILCRDLQLQNAFYVAYLKKKDLTINHFYFEILGKKSHSVVHSNVAYCAHQTAVIWCLYKRHYVFHFTWVYASLKCKQDKILEILSGDNMIAIQIATKTWSEQYFNIAITSGSDKHLSRVISDSKQPLNVISTVYWRQ